MKQRKLDKIAADIEAARRSPQRAADLERIARRLGRMPVKRGKEPVWESETFDWLRPLSIPHHGGRDIALGTKNSILNQLEDDILDWQEHLNQVGNTENEDEVSDDSE